MRWLIVLMLGCSGATSVESTTPEPEPAPESQPSGVESSCRVAMAEEAETFRFIDGVLVERVLIGDAAGTQLEEKYTRDDTGRVSRISVQLVEGVGAGAAEDQPIRYEPGPQPNQLDMHVEIAGQLETVRWTYDERGFPISSMVGERQMLACRRDEQGRIVERDGYRFFYWGDARFPHAMYDPESARTVPVHRFYDAIAFPGPNDEPYVLAGDARRSTGTCAAVFFGACNALFAPPPPSGAVTELVVEPLAARATPDEVARIDLACANPDTESEEGCTFMVERQRVNDAGGALRGVAVIRVTRGPQGHQSTHLAIARADGWWVGSQLADGPFNDNQTSGTLRFETRDLNLMQAVSGGDPEVVIGYDTERTFTDEFEIEHELEERGAIVCLDVANNQQRCVRIPHAIDERFEDQHLSARADVVLTGEGTVHYRDVVGRHPRVPNTELVPLEWFFEP